ncbi:MAG: GSCFA domain-containing protein [Mangrovibacterium sp.]
MNAEFLTPVEPENPGWQIDYKHRLMMLGSCFSEHIGEKFREYRFQTDLNPFGVIFNPLSIAGSLRRLMSGRPYRREELFEYRGIWGSFDHHSRFSGLSAEESLEKINSRLAGSHNFMKQADYLLITFGTAWVYEYRESGQIVANCHKFPASAFSLYRLTPERIVDEYQKLLSALWSFNPRMRVMFTVSPVRHWKNGASGNQLSKAVLLLATDCLTGKFGPGRCAYFPAYEIVMDELRDYRFYAPDMLHLSQVAVDYIWEKFVRTMISPGSLKLADQVRQIVCAARHRPFFPASKEYQLFLRKQLEKINALTICFPYLNMEAEKSFFQQKIRDYPENL